MTRTRITLITAAIVTGVLLAQGAIVGVWNIGFGFVAFGGAVDRITELVNPNLFWSLLTNLLHYAAFGVGVFVVIRFLAPVRAEQSWRRTVIRGSLAAIGGAVAAVVFDLIVSVVAAFTIGAYPFGYSLDAALDPSRVQYGFQNTVAAAITPLIEWLPLVVLACVFLKLWLVAHPTPIETKGRASVSA